MLMALGAEEPQSQHNCALSPIAQAHKAKLSRWAAKLGLTARRQVWLEAKKIKQWGNCHLWTTPLFNQISIYHASLKASLINPHKRPNISSLGVIPNKFQSEFEKLFLKKHSRIKMKSNPCHLLDQFLTHVNCEHLVTLYSRQPSFYGTHVFL